MTLATRWQGEGPAVAWLHGYTMDASTWAELWDLLPGWRHVGVDLPGHGGSPPLEPGSTLSGVAAGVAEVMAGHGATRLVALSFGTTVALQVAIDQPGLVDRLVLAAPAVGGGETEPGTDDRYRELWAMHRAGCAPDRLAEAWMHSPPDIFRGTLAHPALRERLREVIGRHTWSELRTGAMAGVARHPQPDADLAAVTAATLVLVGEQDMPGVRRCARHLADVLPRARVHDVAGAGHLCLLEVPSVVALPLQAHLAGDDSAGPR
ncbi:MAG: alpha/beta fold hydrolase [Mycobacteriales bacterium]